MNTALVAGANGVIGGVLADCLATLPGWRVIGLSRRGGPDTARMQHVAVDLLDADATRAALAGLGEVTHLFYAAYQDRPGWAELSPPNLAMLRNLLDAVEAAAPGLRHVSLMQGYKVYGAHLGPFPTPAREEDPGPMPPEFMGEQQALLTRRQQGKGWSWSAIRPAVVGGAAIGTPLNLALAIALYASISKQLGLPLRFPGKPAAYDRLLEMTDAGLLARGTIWAATEPRAANQAFNIGNGDLIRWSRIWPRIAAYFGLEVAPPLPLPLATVMADKAALWRQMQEKHGLVPHDWATLSSSWRFADFVFSWEWDMFGDGSKARRLGFHDFVETEAMLLGLFDRFRDERVIP